MSYPMMQPSDAALATLLDGAPWRRIAIVGDSIAEGVREPEPGWPDRSWTDWIAAALPGSVQRNLGRRNLFAAQVREQQLHDALAFRPDLTILSAGGNDTFRRRFDAAGVTAELDVMVGALRAQGSDVVLLELMDIVRSGLIAPEYHEPLGIRMASLAGVVRDVAARHGALLVEMREHPACADASLYASDRIHLTTRGHAVVGVEAVHTLARALPAARARAA